MKRRLDHPMRAFENSDSLMVSWALGANTLGWCFNDLDFQEASDEAFQIARNTVDLPKRKPDPAIAAVSKEIRRARIRLWKSPWETE